MQMAYADHREIIELRPRLAEAQMGAATNVKEELRLSADPQ